MTVVARRIEPHLTVVLIAVAAAMFAVTAMRLELPVIDDAAITLAYARTFFAGGGARLTFASAPVEGFSDPLWLLLSGLAFPLHRDPLAFAQHLSIAFGSMALALTSLFGRALFGRSLQLEDAVAPWILCWMPTFAFWAEAGMETCLYGLLLVATVLLAIEEARTGIGSWTGLALGLLCLTRPEAPLSVAAIAIFWTVARLSKWQRPGKQEIRIVLWIAGIFGTYLALRGWYFARVLPNTYYAKSWWDYDSFLYISSFVYMYISTIALALAGVAIVLLVGTSAARCAMALLLLLLGGSVFFAWRSKGDWMPEWRFFAPFCPLLAMTIGAGPMILRERLSTIRSPGLQLAGATAGIAFAIAALGILHRDSAPRLAEVMGTPGLSAESMRSWATDLAELRTMLGLTRARWAIPDVGMTSLASPDDQIIDAAGLADYAIAEHVDDLTAATDYLASEGLPDLIDVHGQSRIGDPRFLNVSDRYVPWRGNGWTLRGLTRASDPRCPGGLAHVDTLPLGDFLGELRAALAKNDAPTAIALWRCGEQHRGAARMPDRATQATLRTEAEHRAANAATPLETLRLLSLATILSNEDAHLRRATEQLRAKLFPALPPL